MADPTEPTEPDAIIRPASTLYNTTRIKRQIRSTLLHVFREIADKIDTANNTGHLKVTMNLPTNIVIDGLPNINAQTEIYYQIVTHLKKKGYSVMVDLTTASKLYIAWKQPVDENRTQQQLEFLAKHSVSNMRKVQAGQTATSVEEIDATVESLL